MKYLILIAVILAGCRATQDTGAAERDALRALRGKQLDGLPLAQALTLQGEMLSIETRGVPDFDSGVVKARDGRLTVKCPDNILNLDSILRSNQAFLAMVTAWKLAEATRDSVARENVVLAADNSRLAKANRSANLRFYGLAAVVIAGAAGWVVWKYKAGGLGLFKQLVK